MDSSCVCGSTSSNASTLICSLSPEVCLYPRVALVTNRCVCRHVKVLCEVVQMIVERFTDLIVAWQGK